MDFNSDSTVPPSANFTIFSILKTYFLRILNAAF